MKQIVYRILCYFVLPLGIFIVVKKEFNSFPIIVTCTVKKYTGFDCPGCGGQRAIASVLNGELKQAFYYNQLIYVYLGALAYIYVLFVETYVIKNKIINERYGFSNAFAFYFIGLILLFFIVRNI